jgi:hypothetical protein
MVLVDLHGREVAAATEKVERPAGAGGSRATWVGTDGVLRALERDGSVHELQKLSSRSAWVQLSPDGTQWLWSDTQYNSGNSTFRSIVHLGAEGGKDVVIADVTDPSHQLLPYRWDSAGPLVMRSPVGVGGYILFFEAIGEVNVIDVLNGRIGKRVETPQRCALNARAADGTLACISRSDTGATLSLLKPDGSTSSIPLPRPEFQQAGNFSFRPGPVATTAVIGGAASVGPKAEQYVTGVISVGGASSMKRFGPDGFAPGEGDWAWLDDGSLVGYGSNGAWELEVHVVAPDGSDRKLTTGRPVGVLK